MVRMPAAARPTATTAQTIVKFPVQPKLLKPCAAVDASAAHGCRREIGRLPGRMWQRRPPGTGYPAGGRRSQNRSTPSSLSPSGASSPIIRGDVRPRHALDRTRGTGHRGAHAPRACRERSSGDAAATAKCRSSVAARSGGVPRRSTTGHRATRPRGSGALMEACGRCQGRGRRERAHRPLQNAQTRFAQRPQGPPTITTGTRGHF
jgi:hypothetical protein